MMEQTSTDADTVSDILEKVAPGGNNGDNIPKRPKIDISSLPTRQYLDQTVVPLLIEALNALNKERLSFGN
ncbi:Protein dpy-30-like protein [Armadillidium nasatum]|uniref:Protein dpy-30-like protein n=1 Tax=Armadillidium nasatum TaxID=96803 RepID=A0A5N5TA93_9CRUS|nr:Protein dpy-30-like protein [Armadillidium nasatum]